MIQQDLKQVGIELDVRSYEFATLSRTCQGNFQLFTLQWVGVSDPDMLRRVFHSKQMPPNGFNRGYYENPEVDRLIDAAMAATDDRTSGALYGEAQRLVAEDAPYISLWYKTNVAVSHANRGRQADALGRVHVPERSAPRGTLTAATQRELRHLAVGRCTVSASESAPSPLSFSSSACASAANGESACCSTIWVSVLRASSVLPASR